MKNLLVMRHAKSDWEYNSPDIDRPLNKRGKKAAPIMGKELLKRNKIPDVILSSPAKRARSTAGIIMETIGFKKEPIIVKDFYFGFRDRIIDTVKAIKKDVSTVMIVGHNPIWEDLIMDLANDKRFVSMPTAAIASIIFDIDDWGALALKTGTIEWIITPKAIN